MRIHHLNCGTMCPLGGYFLDGETRGLKAVRFVCHCLLIELHDCLVLIDTGFGVREAERSGGSIPGIMRGLLQPRFVAQETAARQVEALGFACADVRHIVVTHLDFDHAGGIEDFPNATVHALHFELDAVKRPNGIVARMRYRPQQLLHDVNWRLYQPLGEQWMGFECVRNLEGLPPEILLVPLAGHTAGHCGVAVQTTGGWLLHAGDAYYFRGEMELENPRCPLGIRVIRNLLAWNLPELLTNQACLRQLVRERGAGVQVFSAHDHVEFDRLAAMDRKELATALAPELKRRMPHR